MSARLTSWSWERQAEAAPTFNPSTKVVLFTPGKPDPLIARIEAELAALGIAVQKMTAPPEAQIDAVVTREIAAGASAAIRVVPHSRKTEVWTRDTTARVASRRSIKPTSDAAMSLVALRTVEFLRASLLDVKRRETGTGAVTAAAPPPVTAPPPKKVVASESPSPSQTAPAPRESPSPSDKSPAAEKTPAPPSVVRARPPEPAPVRATNTERPPEPPPPPAEEENEENNPPAPAPPTPIDVAEPASASRGRFAIAAGPAVLASPGGNSPLAALAVIGRVPIAGRLGAELMAIFPVTSSPRKSADGSVETSIALFGGAASLRLTPATGPWIVDLALGASVTMLRAVGRATGTVGNTPNVGSAVSTQMITGHSRLGAGYHVNRWLVLRADVVAGVLASRLWVATLHTDTAGAATKLDDFGSWGPLFGGGTLSLQASW